MFHFPIIRSNAFEAGWTKYWFTHGLGLDEVQILNYAYSDTVPLGHVISSRPDPGDVVPPNTTVFLLISLGPLLHPLPYIVGLAQATAEAVIVAAGMTVGTVTTAFDAAVPSGLVSSQTPAFGNKVSAGTTVDFTVSLGAQQGTVPWTPMLPEADAIDTVELADL